MKFLLMILVFLSSCTHSHHSPIERAMILKDQSKYQEAIDLISSYKDKRLSVKNREEWDNPYFYNLFLVDLYLKLEKPLNALNLINQAHNQNIDERLILDRVTNVLNFYEERGQFNEAAELMYRYHTLNPIICEIHLDRLMRKITKLEEAAKQ